MPDFELDHDEALWIVLPTIAEEGAPRDHWEWARRTARTFGLGADGDGIEEAATTLARVADHVGRRRDPDDDLAEVVLVPHREGAVLPLPVQVHVWPCSETDREDELRALVRADDPDAVEPPVVERIALPRLGEGLQALSWFPLGDGAGCLYAVLSYAWRVEESDADVRVSCSTPDLGRLSLAVEDIDELVQGLRFEE